MSNPSGPYGPGPAPGPGASGGTGPFLPPQPGARPSHGPGPAAPPPGAWERRPAPPEKGVIGALLDTRFNHLVTPKLIRLWYIVALLLISLQCLVFFFLGLWMATWDDGWAWGVIMIIACPLVWLFEALLVRIAMEAMVVRFKGVEHLRVIRDKI